jgi:hypothetical protein
VGQLHFDFQHAFCGSAEESRFPNALTITRHSFIDVGPRFDFYEVIQLTGKNNRTYVSESS